MNQPLTHLIFLAGLGQITILIASILVPFRLNWQDELRSLGRLHRQMHWVYGGYVVLSIIAFAALSIRNSAELASGSALARGFCGYVAVFWGIRLALQAIFDIKEYLNTWWTKAGYFALSLMFAALTIVYSWAALQACPRHHLTKFSKNQSFAAATSSAPSSWPPGCQCVVTRAPAEARICESSEVSWGETIWSRMAAASRTGTPFSSGTGLGRKGTIGRKSTAPESWRGCVKRRLEAILAPLE
jgi:hypothetical protein